VEFVGEAAQLLAGLDNPVEREIYGVRAAEAAGISREAMTLEVDRAYKARQRKAVKKEERAQLKPRAHGPAEGAGA
jgi:DNA primase